MEKIEKYIEELFIDAPVSKKTEELKNELIMDLTEKYEDLIKEGKSEKEAINDIISSIGEIDILINSLKEENKKYSNNDTKKKTALIVSISIGIYIISLIATIVSDELGLPEYVTASSFLLIAGIATCILVYHFMSLPKYKKNDETMIEEFKEWHNNKSKNEDIKKTISSIIWTLVVIVYLLMSFITRAWHITWILFIIAVLVEQIVKLIMDLRR